MTTFHLIGQTQHDRKMGTSPGALKPPGPTEPPVFSVPQDPMDPLDPRDVWNVGLPRTSGP